MPSLTMPRRAVARGASILAAVLAAACATAPTAPRGAPRPLTEVPRETRGMWVATVGNIDWPSKPGLPAAQQREELAAIMTRAAATGINTIVFHVRPAGDAVYASALEPWAAMLTGTQGQDPGYDPLAVAVAEAHARGMELHAWINPYRAGVAADSAKLAPTHLFHTRRDLVRVYGTGLWMDPGEPEVLEHAMRVIADIVRRYDVDGVHADDYFYPYVQNDSAGRPIPFPDSATYARYAAGGGTLGRDDWRRANVDRFIERMSREVHAIKPSVKVGISPFGIWRPGFPASVQGMDAYATIYADSRKWLQEGWVDYLAPQLYWGIASPGQSYPALLDWWLSQNVRGRHLWPGLATYRVNNGRPNAFTLREIPDQIRLTRARAGATGHILYNGTTTLRGNGGAIADSLRDALYQGPAMPPASPWLDSIAPGAPTLERAGDTLRLVPAAGEPARWWAVRTQARGSWTTRVLFGDARALPIAGVDRALVQAADQAGNLSAAAEWRR